MDITSKKLATILVLTIVLAIGLTEIYLFFGRFITEQWMAAASVNSIISIAIVLFLLLRREALKSEERSGHIEKISKIIGTKKWLYYAPSLAILLGALILAGLSLLFVQVGDGIANDNVSSSEVLIYILFVVWIPPIEEIVFRVGIGNWLRSRGGLLWGSYFSAILFSLVHGSPSIQNLLQLKIGFPLGPLILGMFNEYLYLISGKKIGPIICFHAVCNATALIFLFTDQRWLEWLGFLFLK